MSRPLKITLITVGSAFLLITVVIIAIVTFRGRQGSPDAERAIAEAQDEAPPQPKHTAKVTAKPAPQPIMGDPTQQAADMLLNGATQNPDGSYDVTLDVNARIRLKSLQVERADDFTFNDRLVEGQQVLDKLYRLLPNSGVAQPITASPPADPAQTP